MANPGMTVQLLDPSGTLVEDEQNEPYAELARQLSEHQLREFHRQMVIMRHLDTEAGNLQRQGQLALWVPSHGQEAAQVGSAFAARPQDHLFPSYREHVVGRIRGLDTLKIVAMLRGLSHGGWEPAEVGNFHLYTLVIGSQALHATGYAMGLGLEGRTGDPEQDAAVIVYFGDGATSQGDLNEALVFAASYQTPQVFFLQNNHWAISVPVSRQSRTPLYRRAEGFGMPGIQVDGNDVLASYAVSRMRLEAARAGDGPSLIEALTYRIGAHTTSDDPTKYRANEELQSWIARDPIVRFEAHLRGLGEQQEFFDEVATEARDLAADLRTRTLALEPPPSGSMFAHVYSEPHPVMQAQAAWLAEYESSLDGGAA